jgi:hypothetical protein
MFLLCTIEMEEMEEEMYDDEEEFLRQPLSRVEEVDEEDEEDSDEDNIVLPLIKHQEYDDDEYETFEEETEDEEEDDSFEVWAPDLVKNLASAQAVKGSQVKEKPLDKKVSGLHPCVVYACTLSFRITSHLPCIEEGGYAHPNPYHYSINRRCLSFYLSILTCPIIHLNTIRRA